MARVALVTGGTRGIGASISKALAGYEVAASYQRSEGTVRPDQLFRGEGRRDRFTKALALENAKGGITVNAICPGYINTEMVQAVPKEVLEKSILPRISVGRLATPRKSPAR